MTFPWLQPTAAYIHVPFCAHHCGYCDFAVASGQDHQIDLYLEALGMELAALGAPEPMTTIFIGGGTPTYLSVDQLDRLLGEIVRWLPLQSGGEWSIESTPESITPEKAGLLARYGVSRISVGVQSFHSHLLPVLDRIHGPDHVAPAVAAAKGYGLQVSLDLIFGVPGQTLTEWQRDLERAMSLEPDHLSTYGLTFEKGTPLWKQRERKQVRSLDEESEREMFLGAIDMLTEHGFEHYEISNFAKPGLRCRHNEIYWANHAYHGFGMGAARYVQGRRELNTRNLGDYLRKVLAGESPTFQSECLEGEDRARETAIIQLRRGEGIGRSEFAKQTGFSIDALAGERIGQFVGQGVLADTGERILLTREGKCLADEVMTRLL